MRRALWPTLFLLAAARVALAIICPDGYICSDGTCCPSDVSDLMYACCPYRNAVCCLDYSHCCPEHYWCDLDEARCLPSPSISHPLLRRRGSEGSLAHTVHQHLRLSDVNTATDIAADNTGTHTCPDGQKTCEDAATCCKLAGGDYTCCPESNAVCCDDHIHCCPEGTRCDVKARTCQKDRTHMIIELFN